MTGEHATHQRRMGAVDLAFGRMLKRGELPTGFVLDFPDGRLSVDALRQRVRQRLPHIPALAYRVDHGRRALVPAGETETDVDAHIWEITAGTERQASEAERSVLTAPLPSGARAPWDVTLTHRSDGGQRLVLRTDHTLLDGVGSAQVVRALLEDDPHPGPPAHRPRRLSPAGVGGALSDTLAAFCRPVRTPGFTVPAGGNPSIHHADTSLGRLRDIGATVGATVNDVYLAALAHALGSLLTEEHQVRSPLTVGIPQSLRTEDERLQPGNRLVTARLALPTAETTPTGALARTTARARRLRARRQRDAMGALVRVAPRRCGAFLGARGVSPAAIGGLASNVNLGPTLVHQGEAATAAMFTALPAGLLLYTALTGQGETARFTVVHDEALPGAAALPRLWLAALASLQDGPVDAEARP